MARYEVNIFILFYVIETYSAFARGFFADGKTSVRPVRVKELFVFTPTFYYRMHISS